ncbi:MAG: UrcA family protein [Steroidobacteraceae bacterium]|jgi:UrcA family protein
MTIVKELFLGAAVSVISLGCAAAFADSAPNSLKVRFGDLNLQQPRDIARLYNRIRLAADQTCGPRAVGGYYTESVDYRNCYSETIAQAIARLDRPAVTAYYRERSAETAAREQLADQ